MNKSIDKQTIIDKLLPRVLKPVTYQGNEVNAVHKNPEDAAIRFAFAFPDLYEVGMSHLGMRILYGLLNKQADIYCERVFAPQGDMEALMREHDVPLFALETMDPIGAFDFVGFTLQYEMCYTTVLNMLDLAGIPLLRADRGADDPIIIGGGPCCCNPEPLCDFFDLFVIGEGEDVITELMDLYRAHKQSTSFEKKAFLKAAAAIEGVYVPALYDVTYHEDGTIKGVTALADIAPLPVRKRFVRDLENAYFPEDLVIPYAQTVHDRIPFEIFRGCGRGCRFCQAGMIYRPTRDKSVDCIESGIATLVDATGYEEVSLLSLSSGDYPDIEKLISDLVETYESKRVSVALPSLRIDSVSVDMLEEIQKIRKSGITLAPEAGTQRMRDVINKGVTEEDLISTVTRAFAKGWGHIKLYFMIGLPTETDDDVAGIAELAEKVVDAYFAEPKETRNKSCQVVVSTSCFVPKPFTPFQWFGQVPMDELIQKQNLLKQRIKSRKIKYNWHASDVSFYEAVLARGDRRLGAVLKTAFELGCKLDGWNDYFDAGKWRQAFDLCGIDPDFYALRTRPFEETLPWDHIDMGVSKAFLQREWTKAIDENTTVFCREGCAGCGIMAFDGKWQCHPEKAMNN